MPLGSASENASPDQPSADSIGETPALQTGWVIPIGGVGGTRFYLSCSVLIAAAILVGVVATVTGQQGNADLPLTSLLGAGFWVGAWVVQSGTVLLVSRLYGRQVPDLTINLLGPQSRSRKWPAVAALMVGLSSMAMLLLCGLLFWWADGGFRTPVFSGEGPSLWIAPSIGLSQPDSVWLVGAWLFWVQAVFQMYPLPGTTGRQVLGAITELCSPRIGIAQRVSIYRRCLSVIALATLLLAACLMLQESSGTFPRWPLLMLLGVLLWMSVLATDLRDTIEGFQISSRRDETSLIELGVRRTRLRAPRHPMRMFGQLRFAIRARQERRRIQQAMENERREAFDAERLDEILSRLHRDGADSLSDEDRQILDRVSQTLRKQRQIDTAGEAGDGE